MRHGFRYRGRHTSEFGVNLIRHTINSPELREEEDEVAGLPGTLDYGTEWGKREIEMVIDISPTNEPLKLRQSKILNWLKPTLSAGVLVFDELPGRFYFAKFTKKLGVEQFGTYGEFEFSFKCTDPFAYGDEIILQNYFTQSPESLIAGSEGTEVTPPVIELTNHGSNTITSITIQNEYEVED